MTTIHDVSAPVHPSRLPCCAGRLIRAAARLAILLPALLAGCTLEALQPQASPSVPAEEVSSPPATTPLQSQQSAAPAPRDTATTAAPRPTITPRPSATPPPPTATQAPLSSEGPWLVFAAEEPSTDMLSFALWAVNADGSGAARIGEPIPQAFGVPQSFAASPGGGWVSFLAEPTWWLPELRLISLPDGRVETLARLMPPGVDTTPEDPEALVKVEQTYAAVSQTPGVWSPDGQALAFVGAVAGNNSDLYLVSLGDRTPLRLTDGPSETVYPTWSPDAKFIVHAAASTLYSGYSGSQYGLLDMWAARADGSGAHRLYSIHQDVHERILGWASNSSFLVDTWVWFEGYSNLRAVDLDGTVRQLWDGVYHDRAYDPGSRTILLSIPRDKGAGICGTPGEPPGMILVPATGAAPRRLDIAALCAEESPLRWSAEVGAFFAQTEDGPVTISLQGEVQPLDLPSLDGLAISPDGRRWAVGLDGLWLGGVGEAARQVFDGFVLRPMWSPDGSSLFFFGASDGIGGAFGLYVAHSQDFAPRLVLDGLAEISGDAPAWVLP